MEMLPRNSTFTYKGKPVKVLQVAEDLGVDMCWKLEGSVRKSGDKLRVTVQLIDALKGQHLWAEQYDWEVKDVFAVQDDITRQILGALQVQLTGGEMARMSADMVSIRAYEKYLKAQEHGSRRTKEDSLIARRLFQEVIALDPEYAMAYVEAGWTYLDEIWLGMTKMPYESIAKAEAMVQKAISIHGHRAGKNALLSSIHLLKKDWDKAIAYGEKAVEQRPNYDGPNNVLGYALRSNGQYDESISRYKKVCGSDDGLLVHRFGRSGKADGPAGAQS
jgi:adenylate cyclase